MAPASYKRLPESAAPGGSRSCTCPYCGGSFYLDEDESPPREETYACLCRRCGYKWNSRVGHPQKCPSCGTTRWDEPERRCTCSVCGYSWAPRGSAQPTRCPSCKTTEWRDGKPFVARMAEIKDPAEVRRRWVMEKHAKGEGCMQIACETGLALFTVMEIVSKATGKKNPDLRERGGKGPTHTNDFSKEERPYGQKDRSGHPGSCSSHSMRRSMADRLRRGRQQGP